MSPSNPKDGGPKDSGPKDNGKASLATVAAKAGVSISTVSRIVNGQTQRASAETVDRVRQVLADLAYRPNHVGRTLRGKDSRLVAMLIANLDNPAMAAIAASTEAALRAKGYVMFLCDTHDRPDLQDDYLLAMQSHGVQGYVMVVSVPSPGLERFVAAAEPIVFVSRPSPFGAASFVGIDNLAAGADAADHFLARGIADFAVLYPAAGSSVTAQRVAGFRDRLLARGVAPDAIAMAAAPGLSHIEIGYQAAGHLAAAAVWPRGIFCVSDQIAYGAHRRALECGAGIADAAHFVSIDGNPINPWLAPWLTSIRVPHADFGPPIVELLQGLWDGSGPARRILPHRGPAA